MSFAIPNQPGSSIFDGLDRPGIARNSQRMKRIHHDREFVRPLFPERILDPARMKRALLQLLQVPDSQLRIAGLGSIVVGLALLAFVRA